MGNFLPNYTSKRILWTKLTPLGVRFHVIQEVQSLPEQS